MKSLWDKGTLHNIDRTWFDKFTSGDDIIYDNVLIPYDIRCNLAQAVMLHHIGVYTTEELRDVHSTLLTFLRDFEAGEFTLDASHEDVHSAIEMKLIKELGDIGRKIHTGRSRNDQVQADIRMYLRERILHVTKMLIGLVTRLKTISGKYEGVYFAGHTHTQPAMPNSVDAWCYGYIDLLLTEVRGLRQSYDEINRSPLGSAAGYGVPLIDVNRSLTADLLAFDDVQYAVTSVQTGRGCIERRLVYHLNSVSFVLNRMASDIILYAHPAFALVKLREDQTSGSSIMPQKRNPDAWELIRGSHAIMAGFMTQLSTIGVGLISGYHRDVQLVKKVVIDGFNYLESVLHATNISLEGLSFDVDACERTLDKSVFATQLALQNVLDGVPFRTAYQKASEEYEQFNVPSNTSLKNVYKNIGDPGHPAAQYYNDIIADAEKWSSSKTNYIRLKFNELESVN